MSNDVHTVRERMNKLSEDSEKIKTEAKKKIEAEKTKQRKLVEWKEEKKI